MVWGEVLVGGLICVGRLTSSRARLMVEAGSAWPTSKSVAAIKMRMMKSILADGYGQSLACSRGVGSGLDRSCSCFQSLCVCKSQSQSPVTVDEPDERFAGRQQLPQTEGMNGLGPRSWGTYLPPTNCSESC